MDSFSELFEVIGVLARRRYQSAERNFAALGLNHSEARILMLLEQEAGTATQDTLANLLFIDRSNVGRAMKGLEQQGYIIRCKNDNDKRANLVHLTPEGSATLVEIRETKQKIIDGFFKDMTAEEARQATRLMKKSMSADDRAALQKETKHQ